MDEEFLWQSDNKDKHIEFKGIFQDWKYSRMPNVAIFYNSHTQSTLVGLTMVTVKNHNKYIIHHLY